VGGGHGKNMGWGSLGLYGLETIKTGAVRACFLFISVYFISEINP
jgi:hypothetical protein